MCRPYIFMLIVAYALKIKKNILCMVSDYVYAFVTIPTSCKKWSLILLDIGVIMQYKILVCEVPRLL